MTSKIAMSTPSKIESTLFEIALLREKIEAKKIQLEEIDDRITLEVHDATGPDGKKAFSNEKLRDIEIRRLQREDKEYWRLSGELGDASYEKDRLTARLERLRGDFKLELIDRLRVDMDETDSVITDMILSGNTAG